MKALGSSLLAALTLSACTAGMNTGTMSSTNTQVVTEYPVETALLNIYTQPRSETLTQVNGAQNSVIDIKVTPKGAMRFDGKRVQGAERSYITKIDGDVVNNSASINYFTLNPTRFYGYTDSSGEYSIATQTADVPKTAKVGDSSQLITENVYSDSNKLKQISRYDQSWSLTQAGPRTAWFCINTSENLLSPNASTTTAECYKINPEGDILSSKTSISYPTNNRVETVNFVSQ